MSRPDERGPDPWEELRRQLEGWKTPASGEPEGAPADRTQAVTRYIECPRCGRLGFMELGKCIYCRAPLFRDTFHRPNLVLQLRAVGGDAALVKVIVTFILLLIAIAFGIVVQTQAPQALEERDLLWTLISRMLILGLIVTGLVGLAWLWIGRPEPLPTPSRTVRLVTWASAGPLLGLALCFNILYSRFVRSFSFPVSGPDLTAHKDLLVWLILVICVQPAVVEEFFFRYLTLNTFRRIAGTHPAVFISSVMFALAHIGNPLGLPVLVVLGVLLGYVRVGSGGLALPMMLHFFHNFAVLFIH